MAHYALLDENNVVVNIITGIDETELIEGLDPETWYGNFHNLTCKRASWNTMFGEHRGGKTPFRKNYPSIGYVYDEEKDAFFPPQPYPSWILDEEVGHWKAPIPAPFDPDNPIGYNWNEATLSWEPIS